MFTTKERLLANEASLTSSLLGNGLNALRRANIYNKGLYYQAFFSISIGIERLLKIIIINQYRCEHNGEFPVDIDLKEFGHDLIKLCEFIDIKFDSKALHMDIISFLNIFAKNTRYYNIDSMISKNKKFDDPLSDWDSLANDIFNSSKKEKSIQNKQELADLMNQVSLISFHDLKGDNVINAEDILDEFERRDIIQSYSVQYMFEIITKIVDKLRMLEVEKYLMPILSEFFILFNKYLKPYQIRRKKNWLKM